MTEGQPRPQTEQIPPLTMTFSAETQQGIFRALTSYLHSETITEWEGFYKDLPERIASLDSIREIYTHLARNLGKEIDPYSALYMGLPDLLPPGQLETWAEQPVRDDKDLEIKAFAHYFLDKRTQQEYKSQTQPPQPS